VEPICDNKWFIKKALKFVTVHLTLTS